MIYVDPGTLWFKCYIIKMSNLDLYKKILKIRYFYTAMTKTLVNLCHVLRSRKKLYSYDTNLKINKSGIFKKKLSSHTSEYFENCTASTYGKYKCSYRSIRLF